MSISFKITKQLQKPTKNNKKNIKDKRQKDKKRNDDKC